MAEQVESHSCTKKSQELNVKDFVEIFEFIAKWRHKPFVMLFVFFGVFLGALYFPLPEGISASIQFRSIFGLIAAAVATAVLSRYQQPPRVKNGYVGIIVAVKSEDEKIRGRISKDFVATCRKMLEETHTNQPFQLIELNDYFSELVTDHVSANQLRIRCNGHLLIYGDAVQRQERGKKLFVLRLQGIVSHVPIGVDEQALLAQEMVAVLPLKKAILEENELSGFEVTSIQLAEATKYIIATAALLSNDYVFAIVLLEELQQKRENLKRNANVKAIKKLIDLIPKRLGDAYRFASIVDFSRWEISRDKSDLQNSINWILKYDKLAPADNLHKLLLSSIGYFIFSRDIDGAMKCINQCKAKYITSNSWKYSAAFLEAYRNNLDKAKQFYDAAISTADDHNIPFQVEGFIAWILEIEPKMFQLNFCLGYLNKKYKNDFVSAQQYYTKFLNSPLQEGSSTNAIKHANNFVLNTNFEL